MKKTPYYLIGLFAIIAATALVISCQKNADQQCNEQTTQSATSSKDGPDPHWDYENTDWADEGFPDCGGTQQSPINIIKSDVVTDATLTPITFSYTNSTALNEFDNGHTLQAVNYNANSITVNGQSYNLLQLHFHEGSEHEIDGVQYPMEIHFVHQNSTTNAITVVGVMVKEGASNSQIFKMFGNWPSTTGDTIETGKTIHLAGLLPANKEYYTYPGSLTTPPCTEGLQWLVLKKPITMSHVQIEYFKTHYEGNFRPVQPLNGRVVKSL